MFCDAIGLAAQIHNDGEMRERKSFGSKSTIVSVDPRWLIC